MACLPDVVDQLARSVKNVPGVFAGRQHDYVRGSAVAREESVSPYGVPVPCVITVERDEDTELAGCGATQAVELGGGQGRAAGCDRRTRRARGAACGGHGEDVHRSLD